MDEGVIWIRANFPEGTSIEQTARFGRQIRAIVAGVPRDPVRHRAIGAERQRHRSLPAQPHGDDGRARSRARSGRSSATKHELVAALGARLREEFPTTRFNFTQPIIDSVTEDTNGTSANLAIEFSGPGFRRAPAAWPGRRWSCCARCPARWT